MKLKSNDDRASPCFETCQILASPDSAIRFSHTFLLALPVTWGYQTQREYYARPPC